MVEKFIEIFEGLDRAYGQFKKQHSRITNKVEGKSWIERKKPTKDLWQNHLSGIGEALGIFPLRDDGTCKWGAIDVDLYQHDYEPILKQIHKLKLPLIMFRSKSGGAHIYLFMKKFTQAVEVRAVMQKFAAKLGLADKLDRIYPLQTSITKDDTGSYLNLPYHNHDEGSRYAYKEDFDSATLEEFFVMYDKYAQDDLGEYLIEDVKKPKNFKPKSFKDFLVPCIKNCLEKNNNKIPLDVGGRNNFLLHTYTWVLKAHKKLNELDEFKNLSTEQILLKIDANYMEKPLGENEITKTIFKSKEKNYKYLCKHPPIKKYCDSITCTQNPFGITPDQAIQLKTAKESFGVITEYGANPPLYYESVDVKDDGENKFKRVRVMFNGDEIINKQKYVDKMSRKGHFLPLTILNLPAKEFVKIQYARLEKRNFERAPEEADEDTTFIEHFYYFVKLSTVAMDKIRLLEGAVVFDEENKNIKFKFTELQKYFETHHVKITPGNLAFKLKHILKADKKDGARIKNREGKRISCNYWECPADLNRMTKPRLKNVTPVPQQILGGDEED